MTLCNHYYFLLEKNSFIVDNQTINDIVENYKPHSIPQTKPDSPFFYI